MKQKFFWALTALIACNAGIEAQAAHILADIDLKLNFKYSTDSINKQVSSIGKVFCTFPDKRHMTIRLNDGASLTDAVDHLSNLSSVEKVVVYSPVMHASRRNKPSELETKQFARLEREFKYVRSSGKVSKLVLPKQNDEKENLSASHKNRVVTVGDVSPGSAQTMGFQYQGWEQWTPKWQNVGPYGATLNGGVCWTGRAEAVAINPNSASNIFAGGADGGVWKTTDGGVNWTPLTEDWESLHISSLAVSANIVNTTVFAGTRVNGIQNLHRSTDGGNTWSLVGGTSANQLQNNVVNSIYVVPDQPSTVLVATDDGLFRSTNAGVTCTKVATDSNGNPMIEAFNCIVGSIKIGQGNRYIYVYNSQGQFIPTQYIYRSSDDGLTWQRLTPPASAPLATFRMATSQCSTPTVYAYSGDLKKVWKSTNAGFSWNIIYQASPVSQPYTDDHVMFTQAWHNSMIGVARRHHDVQIPYDTDVIYVGGVALMYSDDNGTSWNAIDAGHGDYTCFAAKPNSDDFVIGSDGGLFIGHSLYPITDEPFFYDINADLCFTGFWGGAYSATNENIRLGGAQDIFSIYGSQNGWKVVGGNDGNNTAIDPSDDNIQYTSDQFTNVWRTTNGWTTSQIISPSNWVYNIYPPDVDNYEGLGQGSLYVTPTSPHKLLVGTDYLNRWSPGSGWERRLGGTALAAEDKRIEVIRVPIGNANKIYTGSSDGRIYITENGGTSWRRMDSVGYGFANVTDISINPSNQDDILVTVEKTNGTSHLYRCEDTTPASGICLWSDLGALPMPTISMTRDIDDPENTLYIGTTKGVYKTVDSGASWTDYGHALGLPKLVCQNLTMTYNSLLDKRILNVATMGRGFWKIDVDKYILLALDLPATIEKDHQIQTCTVAVTWYAQKGGINVYLTSSNPSALSVPAKVTIPEGQTSTTFTMTAFDPSDEPYVTITAKIGSNTQSDVVQVVDPQ